MSDPHADLLRFDDDSRDEAEALAAGQGTSVLELLRRRAQAPADAAMRDLTAQLRRFGRVLRERVQPKALPTARPGRAAYSMREAARRLGVGRDRLRALCAAGLVRVVPWGGVPRVPSGELERLVLEGLPAQPGEARRAPRRRKGKAAPPAPGVADRIRALPFGRRV